ncbi:hypothetical protein [Haloferula sargassicola]|uniref:Uncharacterized protein n=1 Tax=Haloferula sargassicola TaxID=490096 RepID=A0ABP9UKC5_9BACT
MRESDWRVTWDHGGESPVVMLDLGDLMPDEIGRQGSQATALIRPDGALSGIAAGRGNAQRSLEFTRLDEHDTAADASDACDAELLAAPWGAKQLLSVRPRDGVARFYRAALSGSSHAPVPGSPVPRSSHAFQFRVSPVTAVVLPGGLVVTGGYYNDPETYVFPELPDGVSLPPGSTVEISGPGGDEGWYSTGGTGLPAGGSGGVPVTATDAPGPPTAPVLVSAPTISGDPYPGEILLRVAGTWTGASSIAGVWLRNGAPDGYGATYFIPEPAEIGEVIVFREAATNEVGTTLANSNTITVEEPPFENLTPPSISGTPQVGETLTRTAGTWQSEDSVTGEWYLDGAATGETGATYTIPETAEIGDEILYRETAMKSGSPDLTADSNVLTVAGGSNLVTAPSIERVDDAYNFASRIAGTWSGSPLFVSGEWYRNGAATGSTSATVNMAGPSGAGPGDVWIYRETAYFPGGATETADSNSITIGAFGVVRVPVIAVRTAPSQLEVTVVAQIDGLPDSVTNYWITDRGYSGSGAGYHVGDTYQKRGNVIHRTVATRGGATVTTDSNSIEIPDP